MIDYYARVADLILPHLKGRPLTLRRFPEGVGKPETSFFEKNCPKHRPEWVKTTPIYVDRRAGEIDFCLCENRADPGLDGAARRPRAPPLAVEGDANGAAHRARLRPRPGRAGGAGRVLQGRAAGARALRGVRARGVPQGLRRQGPAGLLPAQHQGDATSRPARSPRPWRSCSRSRRRRRSSRRWRRSTGGARCSSTGARTTRRRRRSPSTRCGPASARPPRSRCTGARSSARRRAARPRSCASRSRDAIKRVEKEGDLFEPVLSSEAEAAGHRRARGRASSTNAGTALREAG